MNDCPKEAPRTKGEEKCKREQPGKTELFRIDRCTDAAKRQGHNRNQAEEHGKTGKAIALEILAFRSGHGVWTIAHGFSKSVRCSGGTSAIAAARLRWSARR